MIRVGIVDSGIHGAGRARVVASADFTCAGQRVEPATGTVPRDLCGHGSRIGAIIAASKGVELLDARIFRDSLFASAAQAAAAIDWLVDQRVRLINLSFGLREDRLALRAACARAHENGIIVLASAPARGEAVFPAGYPGVIRATGDARCSSAEISRLGTPQADFGGCVRDRDGAIAGASVGCANVSAAFAAWFVKHPHATRDEALAALSVQAAYRGPERRRSV